jgi:hypothetical protein
MIHGGFSLSAGVLFAVDLDFTLPRSCLSGKPAAAP